MFVEKIEKRGLSSVGTAQNMPFLRNSDEFTKIQA